MNVDLESVPFTLGVYVNQYEQCFRLVQLCSISCNYELMKNFNQLLLVLPRYSKGSMYVLRRR